MCISVCMYFCTYDPFVQQSVAPNTGTLRTQTHHDAQLMNHLTVRAPPCKLRPKLQYLILFKPT